MDNSFHFLLVKDCQSKGNNARILFWRGCLTSSSIFMGHRRLIKLLLSPAIGPTSLLPATQLFENNSCMIITCSISSSHVRTPPPPTTHPREGVGGGTNEKTKQKNIRCHNSPPPKKGPIRPKLKIIIPSMGQTHKLLKKTLLSPHYGSPSLSPSLNIILSFFVYRS